MARVKTTTSSTSDSVSKKKIPEKTVEALDVVTAPPVQVNINTTTTEQCIPVEIISSETTTKKKKAGGGSKRTKQQSPVIVQEEKEQEPLLSVIDENKEDFDENIQQEIEEKMKEEEIQNEQENGIVEEDSEENKIPVKRQKRVISKRTYHDDFQKFFELYKNELASCKKVPPQTVSLLKYAKQLMSDSFKLLKINSKSYGPDGEIIHKVSSNSGFLKPVRISQELADFLNVDVQEPITRVMITKKICEYIKLHDLQNPNDRREIVLDHVLAKLFDVDPTIETDKITTYYKIQQQVLRHISKI